MGQMHVQRAAKIANGPKKMLCTDVDNARLSYLESGVREAAAKNGTEVVFLIPSKSAKADSKRR